MQSIQKSLWKLQRSKWVHIETSNVIYFSLFSTHSMRTYCRCVIN